MNGAAKRWSVLAWPVRWWARQSLRARLTLISTAIFSVAVLTGAILVIQLQRYALLHVLDASAQKSAVDVAQQIEQDPTRREVLPTTGGVTAVQVVNDDDIVIAASPGTIHSAPILDARQLDAAREGHRLDITSPTTGLGERVLAVRAQNNTVLVVTDLTRIDDSIRVLTRVALIGGPLAVLLMALATYLVAALTLRPVAALRNGASDITAAGLAAQRLPVPGARDEIHRLAITLNAMLDRIDSATSKQRTFVGDAAHELRSPLASLRVQLEVAQRIGPDSDWSGLVDDVLEDVSRLDRLVEGLLSLARLDEAVGSLRHEPVSLDSLVGAVVENYEHSRLPVTLTEVVPLSLVADPDALRRIVVNLVDNGLRHASGGVTITLGLDQSDDRANAVLTVTDDGPGIPEEERERVFDRFYRVEASRSRESGGTGLGLAIVRDLVRAHRGSVRLLDRADGRPGLRAVVTLPVERP
ncbi:ATP-binding protein [Jatrophihabitans sp.]|uniref:sensor histidine kinase n=1 Tax=Jatrophihabitans sp. TaxID=1932789 RepID=UPI0030C6D44D|nr:Signal transduction histidine kinase [Jatrophihabitans sp.]